MDKRAFTLIEMTVVLAILGVIASTVVVNQLERIKARQAQLTAAEISQLQQAAMLYYVNNNNTWPGNISDLKTGGYISSAWNGLSKFGANYTFSNTANLFTVNTTLPAGYAGYGYVFNNSLPMGNSSAGVVSSTIPVPGSATGIKTAIDQALPQHTTIIWRGASCPAGYSRVSNMDDKFLVSSAAYNASAGGSNAHTHFAGGYVMPVHGHDAGGNLYTTPGQTASVSVTVPAHDHGGSTGGAPWERPEDTKGGGGDRYPSRPGHTHSIPGQGAMTATGSADVGGIRVTGTTAVSAANQPITGTSGINATDSRPEYATVLLCEKN